MPAVKPIVVFVGKYKLTHQQQEEEKKLHTKNYFKMHFTLYFSFALDFFKFVSHNNHNLEHLFVIIMIKLEKMIK